MIHFQFQKSGLINFDNSPIYFGFLVLLGRQYIHVTTLPLLDTYTLKD